jgi:hypothetical protein
MGWEVLAAPIKTVDGIFSVVNNQLTIVLPNFRFKDAYTIEMTSNSVAGELRYNEWSDLGDGGFQRRRRRER